MKVQELIQEAISNILISQFHLVLDKKEIHIDYPNVGQFGDLATNVALKYAKNLGTTPKQLAKDITTHLEMNAEMKKNLDKIEVAHPGFINFYLKPNYFLNILTQILDDPHSYGKPMQIVPQKIMVEYGQPNTHKLPHIGHLFSYIAGNSIANILEFLGHQIKRVNYQGDVGLHVAKCLYAWRMKHKPKPQNLKDQVVLLQQCYQEGSALYEQSDEHKANIQALNKAIYAQADDIKSDWQETRQWSLDYYRDFEQQLNVKQETHYFESQVWKAGMHLVNAHTKTVFTPSNGAVVFPEEISGLHTRVFITQHQTPTYETKDLGLNTQKYADWPFDKSIITTAVEQNEYFKVLIKALEMIDERLKNKIYHIGFGMVQLKEGKISSRTGNIISAPELLEAVQSRVEQLLIGKQGYSDLEKKQIVQHVALGSIQFSFLKSGLSKNIIFDMEESISTHGFSGPYIQYTLTRCFSILHKASPSQLQQLADVKIESESLTVLKWLERFPGVVDLAAQDYAPNYLCTYLDELAQRFNHFYTKNPILNASQQEQKHFRLAITQATAQVLKVGLNLLGIPILEKM